MLFSQSNCFLALPTCLGLGGLVLVRQQNRRPPNVGSLTHTPEANKTTNNRDLIVGRRLLDEHCPTIERPRSFGSVP